MNKTLLFPLQISLCTAGYLYASSNATLAQVTSDGTINTQVNQNGNVAEITGGETRGSNLFHSFQDFSVPTGDEAFFNNTNSISNIFSRVTGGNISNIDGAIRANGSASLFLINPAGIIFGENARLNIGGSFYGSSASSILFDDGEFSAVDLENPSLLTINAPIGLGFRDNPEDIVSRSDLADVEVFERTILDPEVEAAIFNDDLDSDRSFADNIPLEVDERLDNGENLFDVLLDLEIITQDDLTIRTFEFVTPIGLQVEQGKDFALIGGNVSIERSAITAPGGKVTLGGVSQAGIVSFTDGSFIFPEDIEKADVSLVDNSSTVDSELNDTSNIFNGTVIDVSSDNGGFINIHTRNLNLDGANLFLGLNNESSSASVAGDITLIADNSISLNNSVVSADIRGGQGRVGDINLTANSIGLNSSSIESFVVSMGAELRNGEGIVGDINLTANSITLEDFSAIPKGLSGGKGTLGDTNLTANSISFDRGFIGSSINFMGQGAIGDINLTANSISFLNSSAFLELLNGGTDLSNIQEATIGKINFDASSISLTDSSVFSILVNGKGTVDSINLSADSISLTDNSTIYMETSVFEGETEGSIEDIVLNSKNITLDNNSTVLANISDGEGIVGDIIFETDSLSVTNQSDISSQTATANQASNINIDASNLIRIEGLDSTISSQTGGFGNVGNVNISTKELDITDSGQISANNFIVETFNIIPGGGLIRNILDRPIEGSGNAGTIDIDAENITLEDRGGIVALSSAGEGGNINLRVDDILSLRNNSEISATAGELDTPGNGGNINIDSQLIIAFPQGNNDITANAFNGAGGNITISAKGIFGIEERPDSPLTNDITASSDAGISGSIVITTPDLNSVQGVTELPTNVVEPEETTQQACEANRELAAKNGLTISGKGGILPEPGLPLNSLNVTINGEANPVSTIPALIETSQTEIQPARGIQITKSGEVILTAYRTNNAGDRLIRVKRNCGQVQ